MVETLRQKPFNERPSQKLGFGGYVKESMVWGLLPLWLGAAAVAFGKITKYNMFPLDGSPSLLQYAYEKVFHAAAKDISNIKPVIDPDRFGFARWGMEKKRAETLTKDTWNFLKTFEVAAIPTVYHFWRRGERQRISLTPLHDRLVQLSDLKPSDDELRAENQSLKQQWDFVKRDTQQNNQPAHQVQGSHHGGYLQERAQEQSMTSQ